MKFLLALLLPLAPMLAQASQERTAEAVFKQLHSLVGNWEGKFANGRAHTISYRLTAGNTVLVETWALAPGRESMTLYSVDGDSLVATHYCPQGNQPRLQLSGGGDKLAFEFRDGTNLQVKGKSHQHAFWIRPLGTDSFERGETYVANGSTPDEIAKAPPDKPVVYTRVGAEAKAP